MVPSTPTISTSPPLSPAESMPSLFIAALPTSIQARIPKIPSLRRSVSMQSVFFRSESSLALSSTPSSRASPDLSSSSSTCSSPPPSRPATSAGVASSCREVIGKDADGLGLVLASHGRQPHSDFASTDVNWKYAQNGFRSLQSALREASDSDCLPELERQIYIESVGYLLRGLPSNLHEGEVSQLRSAAPEGLLEVAPNSVALSEHSQQQQQQDQQRYYLLPASARADAGLPPRKAVRCPRRSLPHIVTHWLATKIYELILVLLPIAASLARWAIAMERKYHVPEAVLSVATTVFLMLYQNAVELYVAVCSMGDGNVGRAFNDGTAYLAEGVALGFREAVFDVARGQR